MPADKQYLETHSHVDFRLDLRPLGPGTWALLGEAKSQAQHIAGALVSPERADELMKVYLSKGVLATTAIEGNTLSEEEVRRILDHTLDLPAPLAIVKAIVAHLYLAWIHPFGDGNGRTARLVELQILLAAGFPVPACQLLSSHYNQTRAEYYRQH